MKTRLPKALLVALLGCFVGATVNAAPEITTTDDGKTYINVGESHTEKKQNNQELTVSTGLLEVGSGDKVGYFTGTPSESTFVSSGFGDIGDTALKNNPISNSLVLIEKGGLFKTYADLTISGSGQVYLAGKYNGNFYSGLRAAHVTISADATGTIDSTDPNACSNLNLRADYAELEKLTVNGGAVILRNFSSGGGDTLLGPQYDTHKSVKISDGLYVNGGSVIMGRYDAASSVGNRGEKTKHFKNIIGNEIKQTGGELTLQGKTYLSASKIEQTSGKMTLASDQGSWHDYLCLGSSTTTISQEATTADTNLHIEGKIGKYSYSQTATNATLNITQKGIGTISIDNGVEFTTKDANSASKITQEGAGKIDLGGDYTSATFNLSQTGAGTINLKSQAKMNAGNVEIAGQGSTLNIASGATLTADEITIGASSSLNNAGNLTLTSGDKLTVAEGGNLILSGGTLDVGADATLTVNGTLTFCLSAAPQAQTLAAVTGDSSTSLLNLAEGSSLTFNPETLVITFTQEILETVYKLPKLDGDNDTNTTYSFDIDLNALLSGAGEDAPELETALLEELTTHQLVSGWGGNYVSIVKTEATATEGVYTVTLQHVPEPATATLSLLALAGLCARRRRH